MNRAIRIFVDGVGVAAATSGVLSQVQGRIFALLYLTPKPLSLDQLAAELQQSKSNLSVAVRGLLEWHLVRQISVAGSRKDHYEAATDFWLVMREIMERRFRWNLRQVLTAASECRRELADAPSPANDGFSKSRLDAIEAFFMAVDAGINAFTQGKPFEPGSVQKLQPSAGHARRHR